LPLNRLTKKNGNWFGAGDTFLEGFFERPNAGKVFADETTNAVAFREIGQLSRRNLANFRFNGLLKMKSSNTCNVVLWANKKRLHMSAYDSTFVALRVFQ